jgi:hypothetical protein
VPVSVRQQHQQRRSFGASSMGSSITRCPSHSSYSCSLDFNGSMAGTESPTTELRSVASFVSCTMPKTQSRFAIASASSAQQRYTELARQRSPV